MDQKKQARLSEQMISLERELERSQANVDHHTAKLQQATRDRERVTKTIAEVKAQLEEK